MKVCVYRKYFCRAVFIWLHYCCAEWEGWYPLNPVNHTNWMTVVTPTDRSKSVRNCFWWRFCVVHRFSNFRLVYGFCHRTKSDLVFFSWSKLHTQRTWLSCKFEPPLDNKARGVPSLWTIVKLAVQCVCLTGHVKEPYWNVYGKRTWQELGQTFQLPAHLCVVT